MRPEEIKYIVLHCSATRSDVSYSVEHLDRDHRLRGFRSAGYHYYILRSGSVVPLRTHSEIGAHCLGYNRSSLGICYEGGISPLGLPADTRTAQQRRAIISLLEELLRLYPTAQIVGHRDLSLDRNRNGRVEPSEWIKVCPCFDAQAEYRYLQKKGDEA